MAVAPLLGLEPTIALLIALAVAIILGAWIVLELRDLRADVQLLKRLEARRRGWPPIFGPPPEAPEPPRSARTPTPPDGGDEPNEQPDDWQ